jgi:hypothetical protein
MIKVQMLSLSLAAVLVGPVHAQSCSGGDGGGIDATGNQCSTPNEVVTSAAGSRVNLPSQADKLKGVHASTPTAATPIRSAKMSGRPSALTVVAVPAGRIVRAAVAASAIVKTADVHNESEAPCSGGAYGGMDVNGNQCGEAPAPDGNNLVAQNKAP